MSVEIPKSVLFIMDFLKENGPMAPREIARKAEIPLRTVSFALRRMTKLQLCKRIPNLQDMRRPLYHVDGEKCRAVFMKYGKIVS